MRSRSGHSVCVDRSAVRGRTVVERAPVATLREDAARLYEAVFEATPSGMAVVATTPEGAHRIVTGNTALADLHGCAADLLPGRLLEDLLADPTTTVPPGKGWHERLCRTAGGAGELWTRWHLSALPGVDGHLLVQIDVIHERVLARLRAMRQTRLLDLIPEPVIIRSLDGTILYWNSGAAEIYGHSAAAALGKRTHDLLHTRFHGVTLPELEATLATNGSWRGQLEHTHADGRVLRMASKHVRDTNVDGETVILEVNVDITDQHAAELALAASEIKFRSLFATSNIGQLVRRMDGTIEEVNEAFAAMVGMPAGELLETTPDRLLGESLTTVRAKILEALHSGSTELIQTEGHLVRADGSLLDVEVNASLVRDRDGTVERVVSFWQDITARKAAEKALAFRASHDTLTGLPNRALLLERLGAVLTGAPGVELGQSTVGLLYIDLDGFKAVNDTFGHQIGDHLLCEVANRLMQCVRDTDTVARLGGDEFVVLCPDLESPDRLSMIAERVLQRVSTPFALEGHFVDTVTASIGLSFPKQDSDAAQALSVADGAMYRVKRTGKNNIAAAS